MSTINIQTIKSDSADLITPEIASEWLNDYGHSYSLRKPDSYKSLVEDLKNGRWKFNGSSILIDVNQNLIIDGVMRLMACVESGVAFKSFIISVEGKAINIDTGTPRTLSHALKHRGYPNASALGATFTKYYAYKMNGNKLSYFFTGRGSSSIVELTNAIPNYPKVAELVGKYHSLLSKAGLPGTLCTALAVIFNEIDSDLAEEFMDTVTLSMLDIRSELKSDDPVRVLRDVINKQARTTTPFNGKMKAALFIKAWNLWRQGKQCDSLKWKVNGRNAEEFPTPI